MLIRFYVCFVRRVILKPWKSWFDKKKRIERQAVLWEFQGPTHAHYFALCSCSDWSECSPEIRPKDTKQKHINWLLMARKSWFLILILSPLELLTFISSATCMQAVLSQVIMTLAVNYSRRGINSVDYLSCYERLSCKDLEIYFYFVCSLIAQQRCSWLDLMFPWIRRKKSPRLEQSSEYSDVKKISPGCAKKNNRQISPRRSPRLFNELGLPIILVQWCYIREIHINT